MGATGFGYEIASQFGHRVVGHARRPGAAHLRSGSGAVRPSCPAVGGRSRSAATARASARTSCSPIAASAARRSCRSPRIWHPGDAVEINLLPRPRRLWSGCKRQQAARPDTRAQDRARRVVSPRRWRSVCAEHWFASKPMKQYTPAGAARTSPRALGAWRVVPADTEGYRTAEVTLGGVDTATCRPRPWSRKAVPAFISSARCSTSPATSAASTSNGPGRPATRRRRLLELEWRARESLRQFGKCMPSRYYK